MQVNISYSGNANMQMQDNNNGKDRSGQPITNSTNQNIDIESIYANNYTCFNSTI